MKNTLPTVIDGNKTIKSFFWESMKMDPFFIRKTSYGRYFLIFKNGEKIYKVYSGKKLHELKLCDIIQEYAGIDVYNINIIQENHKTCGLIIYYKDYPPNIIATNGSYTTLLTSKPLAQA